MAVALYYLLLPFIYLIAFLPFKLLYLFSDLLYVFLYKVFSYRVNVVRDNLSNSFPEKSSQELKEIEKKFYHYLCDLILESLKTLTISPASVLKHVDFKNQAVFEKYAKVGKSVIIVMGHHGNWELAGARFAVENKGNEVTNHQLFIIYHALKNKQFDGLVYLMRTRLGNKLYAMKDTIRGMIKDRDQLTATAFIADQTPSPKGAYWTTFLNQETPVFTGTAKISKKLVYPIVYVSVSRPQRGKYIVSAEVLVEDPSVLSEDQISELHTRRLEQDINKEPHIWLWSHKRWKHKRVS